MSRLGWLPGKYGAGFTQGRTLDFSKLAERYLKGTTTVGMKCVDGVVLATDRRVTAGYFIAHKKGKKIYLVDDHIAATVAGGVADAQKLVDQLRAEAKLYRVEQKTPIGVKAVATLASTIMFQSRPFILIVQLLLGGVDSQGPSLYNVDWFGTVTEEKYISTGSGSPVALGYLEAEYREDLTVEEAIPVAVKAVRSAMLRDTGTGEGIDVVAVTKEGVRQLSDEEIESILRKA